MNENLKDLFLRALELCRDALPERCKDVEDLLSYLLRPKFRICIVGGFSRGKSHFINTLIGKSLLPESALPTTSHATIITYGEYPRLEIVQNGQERELPLTPQILSEYSNLENQNNADCLLKLYYPLPLLENGLELVDSPGVDDGESDGLRITCEALINADAAIVMLSAISPLSMTEKEFVKLYLVDRAIPLLAWGVSFLEQFPPEEQANQMGYIIGRAQSVFPDMKFLIASQECLGLFANQVIWGRKSIEEFLKGWQTLPILGSLREKMALVRLLGIIHECLASLTAEKGILECNISEAKEALSSALAELNSDSRIVDELKLKFLGQLNEIMEYVYVHIESFTSKNVAIAKEAGFNQERFDAEFSNLYSELTGYIYSVLQKDLQELANTLTENFNIPENFLASTIIQFHEIPATKIQLQVAPQAGLLDEAVRYGFELGDRIIGHLPMGPFFWPMLKPQISEGIKKIQMFVQSNSQNSLSMEIQISKAARGLATAFRTQVEEIYKKIFEQAREVSREWLYEQRKKISGMHDTSELKGRQRQITELILQGYALKDQVDSSLKNLINELH